MLMTLLLAGLIPSGKEGRQGPIWWWIAIAMATYVLIKVWMSYLKTPRNAKLTLPSLIWITLIAVFMLLDSIRELIG